MNQFSTQKKHTDKLDLHLQTYLNNIFILSFLEKKLLKLITINIPKSVIAMYRPHVLSANSDFTLDNINC